MRDKLIAVLCADGDRRRVEGAELSLVAGHFLDRLSEHLASDARLHPLGFVHFQERIDERLTLRYHLWPEEWAVPDGQENGQIHDHIFELNSIIVGGVLRQTTFKIKADELGMYEVAESRNAPGGTRLAIMGGRAQLQLQTDEKFDRGSAYRLAPGVVHCVETLRRPAATLVLAKSASDMQLPRVFVPAGRQVPPEFVRRHLEPQDLELGFDAIEKLRASLRSP